MAEGKEVQVLVRMSSALAERLDEYRRSVADLPSRPEAVRRLLDEALSKPD